MEALGKLSELVQDMPDVGDLSESQSNIDDLFQKQASQKAYLATLEKEQDHLTKSAEEHREALALKRGQLQDLQLKLDEIKTTPWTATETEMVTLAHPDGLDRKISASTLIDDSIQQNDEALDNHMEENEQYLQDQERSLAGIFSLMVYHRIASTN
jgi:chromosome segregation ATPase